MTPPSFKLFDDHFCVTLRVSNHFGIEDRLQGRKIASDKRPEAEMESARFYEDCRSATASRGIGTRDWP